MLTIRPNRRLDQGTLDRLGERTGGDSELLFVDLSTVCFIDIYAMVVLLTLISLWRGAGQPVRLKVPSQGGVRNYLARMRFFTLLPEGVECDQPHPGVSERPSMLLPVCPLDVSNGERAVDELANFIFPQLPPQLAGAFVEAMAEIASNVLQHSGSNIGFLAAQRFEKDYQGRLAPRLQLVVADAGIGIRHSLSASYPHLRDATDVDAIDLALRPEVTSKPATNSGVGLSTVVEYADAFGGVLRIRSGAGVVERRRSKVRRLAVPELPGTVVAVELASPGRSR